ncbi:MAG: Crp/Fnr family transcriptional regulator [Actinomycetota bacterium]|nr:Crp/Fnr family transcriptional regulator [Actinomycetota bacterium]MDA3014230.1 Crp/Fnr family transcriptional regulator [Actinomycetota bacterium]MDA3027912.1 Crp/Fnr family transcriptional regulator [Actinomycetota bacterium]
MTDKAPSPEPSIDVLARTDLFADADSAALSVVLSSSRRLEMVRGDVLFNEGDAPGSLHVVLSGRIAIVMSAESDSRESVVALMDAGDLFGELGLLDEGPRSATARALEPTVVLEVPYDAVRTLFDDEPRLVWNAARMLANRLRVMDEVLADSVFLDVTGRTAKRIIEMSEGRDEFTLPVTQEELAGMVGASRERVNKAIASFVRLGWIDQHERHYRIIQRDRLELRAR